MALIAPRTGISYLEHQEAGIRWMMEREQTDADVCRGGILADDMGLGKTFQTIGLLKNSPFAFRTLIVCPPAVISAWTDELRACGFGVCLLGAGCSNWSAAPADKVAVYICSYAKLVMYAEQFVKEPFQRMILDEGHLIRNGKGTKAWWSAMAVGKKAECRWILSATPVQNGQSDWTNLCWWLRVRCPSAEISTLAPTVMLRRTMGELRDVIKALPPTPRFISHDLSISADSAEGKLFRALADQLNGLMDSRAVSALVKMELFIRIQQFLVHPQLYIESMRKKLGTAYTRRDWTASATKWENFSRMVTNSVETNTPTIVFTYFANELEKVVAHITEIGGAVFAIHGGMGADKIGEVVTEARKAANEGKPVVVVVQILCGGAGLNLQFCKRILFLSSHWNPAVVHQAVGRAVRIGQSAVVDIHFFRVTDGVMDNIDRLIVEKHIAKIQCAQKFCDSFYEGFEDVEDVIEGFEEVVGSDSESED
jgi:SNF2 family DNA or RNA helicase